MITEARMIEYWKRWKKSGKTNLYRCYKNPSQNKIDVWNYILKHFYDIDDGYGLRIISYNAHKFTVGYIYDTVDFCAKEKITHFKVITKQNIQEIIVNVEAF